MDFIKRQTDLFKECLVSNPHMAANALDDLEEYLKKLFKNTKDKDLKDYINLFITEIKTRREQICNSFYLNLGKNTEEIFPNQYIIF